ncbi:hypothetical protein OG883_46215 [Streptomyces sp. NBC_01142]|uniref:hypothetical protein n=1 Tax=Streptomyces sp. NBC_01142 TaxID=2975865 RepID=UPI002253DB2C|nr:hypothetical protein [Streptomyces sp. NBC_01142]MCX4827036.1 hypothetical protein [Streptomyces sp. NBC_01142]
MNDAINHPEAAQLVDSLVASGGGLVSYEFGAPGRQIAVAAGAHLAARTGTSLTVIDFRHLLPQIRATVAELHPDLTCTPMPAGEAVQHPERNTGGVLVVHTDLLHDPGTREALLARAGAAESLIVASRADVDESVLNTLPGPRFVVSARALMPPSPPNASGPGIHRRFEAAIGTSYSDGFAEMRERQERFVRQLKQGTPGEHDTVGAEESTETVSVEEFTKAVQNADPDELRRRIARVQEQQGQRAADYPAPAAPQQVTRDHQEQSAAHQQQGPQGIGLT